MANTLAGVNLAEIAQQSLPGLSSLFAPLAGIHTDFSNDLETRGESVTTRFPTKPTASSLSGGYAAAAADVAMTSRTITLNKFKGFVYGFNDEERSETMTWPSSSIRPTSPVASSRRRCIRGSVELGNCRKLCN